MSATQFSEIARKLKDNLNSKLIIVTLFGRGWEIYNWTISMYPYILVYSPVQLF